MRTTHDSLTVDTTATWLRYIATRLLYVSRYRMTFPQLGLVEPNNFRGCGEREVDRDFRVAL